MTATTTTCVVFQPISVNVLAFRPLPKLIQYRRRSNSCVIAKKQSSKHVSVRISAARQPHSQPLISSSSKSNDIDMLTGSTRTVTTIFGMVTLCIKTFLKILPPPNLLTSNTVSSSLMFAYFMGNRTRGSLNTPLTVVAAGLKKWLDIYSGVLLVRVLLSWFPNIPWERQPLSAIRDLCDPYLSLFRNIIPPVFGTLDISPLLAFAVLGTLASLLTVPV